LDSYGVLVVTNHEQSEKKEKKSSVRRTVFPLSLILWQCLSKN